MTRRWKSIPNSGTLSLGIVAVSFTVKLRSRDDGKQGYRKAWTQLKRATKSPQGKAAYERLVRNGKR